MQAPASHHKHTCKLVCTCTHHSVIHPSESHHSHILDGVACHAHRLGEGVGLNGGQRLLQTSRVTQACRRGTWVGARGWEGRGAGHPQVGRYATNPCCLRLPPYGGRPLKNSRGEMAAGVVTVHVYGDPWMQAAVPGGALTVGVREVRWRAKSNMWRVTHSRPADQTLGSPPALAPGAAAGGGGGDSNSSSWEGGGGSAAAPAGG
jgi:hypothetical protein